MHDTTAFEFGGQTKREGLGHLIRPAAQGFFGHFSLALAADGTRTPLGLLALETVFRLKKPIGHKNWSPDQSLGESERWLRGVAAAEALLVGLLAAAPLAPLRRGCYPGSLRSLPHSSRPALTGRLARATASP